MEKMNIVEFTPTNKAEKILKKFMEVYLEEDIRQEAIIRTRIELEIFNYLVDKYPEFSKKQNINKGSCILSDWV